MEYSKDDIIEAQAEVIRQRTSEVCFLAETLAGQARTIEQLRQELAKERLGACTAYTTRIPEGRAKHTRDATDKADNQSRGR